MSTFDPTGLANPGRSGFSNGMMSERFCPSVKNPATMGHHSPGTTLGVVGGGQLGRMLGEAATPLGIDLVVSDPTPGAPASTVAREQVVGEFDDEETIRAVAEKSDVLTFEIELADPDALERVSEQTDTPVHPHPETLRTIQDKFVQKNRLSDAGVPVPAYRRVDSAGELRDALAALGYPAMLKAREGGYDGRGNVPVESPGDVAAAFDAIDGPAMVEEYVDFERELAVIGCRGRDERDTFPVTETIHREEILRESVSPARASEGVRARARDVAEDVLDVMSGRGVYGIELFETADGEILLNEIAPRPHNSGHWTIEGCHVSQFQQHARAVAGLPLGTTERREPTVSANILGDVDDRQAATLRGMTDALETDRLAVHWYGKREVYPLRKMGHVTLVGSETSTEDLLAATRDVRDGLTFEG
jgi:5-(carboxyamino)imidazole ribonucleotide synthase